MRLELLKQVSRVVVKLGTGVLTDDRKQLDPKRMAAVVRQVAALCDSGLEVVLVTSGAVGAGMGGLGFERRPTKLAELQACAAVGQFRLMGMYERLFSKHGRHAAQVLLTHEDLKHKERHLNARNTLVALLERGVIPIINENDAVSFTELQFGDNDKLSALVASLIPADLVIILTTVDGVIENFGTPEACLLSSVEQIDAAVRQHAQDTMSDTAVGGMSAKLEAARIAMRSGIPLVIANGTRRKVLADVLAGKDVGTIFLPGAKRLRGRKRWIAFFHHPRGAVVVDEGAKEALRSRGKSLLAPGIVRCEGSFKSGEVISIRDAEGTEFARGLAQFDAAEIRGGKLRRVEIVHRDNLVIL